MTTMAHDAAYWIDHLELEPHPEGGFFRETYRADEVIAADHLPERFAGARCMSTAIYFLLRAGEFSALHRIASDELWHFYAGTSLCVYEIEAGGAVLEHYLGANPNGGQAFQVAIGAGSWFGAEVVGDGAFSLVGCTVAPGFDFVDFELAERESMLQRFPEHSELIDRLTHR